MLQSHHFSAILTASAVIFTWKEVDFLALLNAAAKQARLTPVGELAFSFTGQGISAIVLLQESHVALHFWPEKGKVSVDIHTCDYQQENQEKARVLAEFLAIHLSGSSSRDQWYNLSISG